MHKVKHKHVLARNYFSRLPGMAEYMRAYAAGEVGVPQAPSITGKSLKSAGDEQPVQ